MKPSELTVLATQGQFIYVTAPLGTVGYDWPATLDWRGGRYKYICNEPITRDMDAGGYAKYEAVASNG